MWNPAGNIIASDVDSNSQLLQHPRNASAYDTCRDKENAEAFMQTPDLSLYSETLKQIACHKPPQRKLPLEDHDPNSQDSGYASGCRGDSKKRAPFVEHPQAPPQADKPPVDVTNVFLVSHEFEQLVEEDVHPQGDYNALITKGSSAGAVEPMEIAPGQDFPIHSIYKQSKDVTKYTEPNSAMIDYYLSTMNDIEMPLQPPKKQKMLGTLSLRTDSAAEENIKFAVQRASADPNLIGDFTKPYCLPLVPGRYQDLKAITAHTLALLIQGEFAGKIPSYKIIDCRYPYEFEGGHISGAVNLYTKEQLLEKLFPTSDYAQKCILVFHCEFSSNRGPNLYRFLRNYDRNCNEAVYPALYYPEMYVLEGGYKSFYQEYAELCIPRAYIPMNHPQYLADLGQYKEKSRIWGNNKINVINKNRNKRLDFV